MHRRGYLIKIHQEREMKGGELNLPLQTAEGFMDGIKFTVPIKNNNCLPTVEERNV